MPLPRGGASPSRKKGAMAMLRGGYTFANSFGKKNIPLEPPPEDIVDEPNFTWLADGLAEGKSRSHRWDRLHLGLTEYQSHAIGMASKDVGPSQLKTKILRRIVRPLEDDELVGPLAPMKSKDFAPLQQKPSSKPGGSHYNFFQKICPFDTSTRRMHREKELTLKNPQAWNKKDQSRYGASIAGDSPMAGSDGGFFMNASTPSSPAQNQVQPSTPSSKAASPKAKAKLESQSSRIKYVPNLQQKLPLQKRQACEAIRMAIFGDACWQGKEAPKTDKEKLEVLMEPRGSEKQVIKMWQCWSELDKDNSGDCDMQEFLVYFRDKGVPYIAERALKGAFGIDNAGKAFRFENLMTMLWPRCEEEDVSWMKGVIDNYKLIGVTEQVSALDLPEEMYLELIETFNWIDADGGGSCSVKELLDCELFPTKEKALETMSKFELGEADELSLEQFLEVMCPAGYQIPKRDHARSAQFARDGAD